MLLRRNNTRLFTLIISTGLIGVAAACSSATVEPIDGPSRGATTKKDGGSTSSDNTPSDRATAKQDAGTTSSGGNADKCAAEATSLKCAECCGLTDTIFQEADQVFDTCACETDTDCKTECGASFCADKEPSQACETCLTQKCDPKANTACESNAACKAFVACETAAGCRDKPTPDAG